jgi:hypothetical protein
MHAASQWCKHSVTGTEASLPGSGRLALVVKAAHIRSECRESRKARETETGGWGQDPILDEEACRARYA